MTDELDKLRRGFRAEEPVRPRDGAREAAISAAMTAFAEKNQGNFQGSSVLDRLKSKGSALLATLKRRRSMTFTNIGLKYVLAGGASLTVLAVTITNLPLLYRDTGSDTGRFGMFNSPPSTTAPKPPVAGDQKPASVPKSKIREESEMRGNRPVRTVQVKPDGTIVSEDRSVVGRLFDDEKNAATGESLKQELFVRVDRSQMERKARVAKHSRDRISGLLRSPGAIGLAGKARLNMPAKPAAGIFTPADQPSARYYKDQGRDKFTKIKPNPVKVVREEPVSTFSIDVDTASYSFMRAALKRNVLPQKDSVRIEELINYFPYDYEAPSDKAVPFKSSVTVMPTPWNKATRLLHIGIKGYDLPKTEKPRANLVFLIDSSGSMNAPNKLPLLQNSFKLLLSTLDPEDTVAIVTYAGSAGTVLEPTKVKEKAKILGALDRLHAGGSTAGAEGIRQAYQLAAQNYDKNSVNRVILATDGDFNVGITNREELKSYIERKRKTGVFLSVLGFGMGNYNDALMQTLAQNGNGNAAYIDSLSEARKVLVEEAGSTLFTIAKDVKIQIEFNPRTVSEYRLIGYETRALKREDFNNDKIDAGDIGAGHTVTAIYEITPKGSGGRLVDDLRYGKPAAAGGDTSGNEYAFLKIRYKLPGEDTSKLITTPVTKAQELDSTASTPDDVRFASSVAAFGQLLRGGRYTKGYSHDDVIALAQASKGRDEFGYRAEFINLVRLAKSAAALAPLDK